MTIQRFPAVDVFSCVLLVLLATGQRGHAQDVTPHESPATGPWIKTPGPRDVPLATSGIDGHCGFVERDGFVSVQVNVDLLGRNIVGDAANEPSIAIDPTNPRKMAIGWRQFDSVLSDFRQAGVGFSHDGGATWTFPGSLTPGVFGTDHRQAVGCAGRRRWPVRVPAGARYE